MNRINPAKLLHSKWTAVEPKNKEKHFLVVEVGGYRDRLPSRSSHESPKNLC